VERSVEVKQGGGFKKPSSIVESSKGNHCTPKQFS